MTGRSGREWPTTAEGLVRSRFAAFRDGDAEWLLACWHPSTRPAGVDLGANPQWRRLQVVEVVGGTVDDLSGLVEFRATYLAAGGGIGVLRERSRFVRKDGRWYYLDGDAQRDPG